MLELKKEVRTFNDRSTKKEVEYEVFYVELSNGLQVILKTTDNTAKALLLLELSKREEQVK